MSQDYCTTGSSSYCSNPECSGSEVDYFFFASGSGDDALIECVNLELIENIIGTSVALYMVDPEKTIPNIWGETKKKFFYNQIKLYSYVYYEEPTNEMGFWGKNVKRKIKAYFHNKTLEKANLDKTSIKEGDVIEWNNVFYEISNVSDGGALLHGKLSYTTYCEAFQTSLTQINIE